MRAKPQCPTCGEDGAHVTSSSHRVEQLHFLRRMLWDGHKLRQALSAGSREILADTVGRMIRGLDRLSEILLDSDE